MLQGWGSMDPVTILGISLACIIAGEALIAKIYIVVATRFRRQPQEPVSSPVSDTM
jgi:hypothetical protein